VAMTEIWRTGYGLGTSSVFIDNFALFEEKLLIVAGFTLPSGIISCNGYISSPNEYIAIVNADNGQINNLKRYSSSYSTLKSLFSKILIDN
jgi:hypothetical protein